MSTLDDREQAALEKIARWKEDGDYEYHDGVVDLEKKLQSEVEGQVSSLLQEGTSAKNAATYLIRRSPVRHALAASTLDPDAAAKEEILLQGMLRTDAEVAGHIDALTNHIREQCIEYVEEFKKS